MKYLLMGVGGLVGISALVWMATQNTPTIDSVSVGKKQEVEVEGKKSAVEVTSAAQAHDSHENLTDNPVVASDASVGTLAPVSEAPEGQLATDVALSGKKRTTSSSPSSKVENPVSNRSDIRPKKALGVNLLEDPSLETLKSEGSSSLQTPDGESSVLEGTASPTDLSNEEYVGESSFSQGGTEPTIDELVELPDVQIDDSEEELIASDLIALPTLAETTAEQEQSNRENNPMAMSTGDELVNAEPPVIAKDEAIVEEASPNRHESMTRSSDENSGYKLEVLGIQGGFNAEYVAIPPTEKEDFEHLAIFGAMSFPKRYNYDSGWEIRFRMNGSAGLLRGDGDLGFIATIVPGIVFWYPEWNISINGGPGLAYVSREKYGEQDLGGPIQIVGQGGLTYYVTDHVGIGWRFHHISDAGMWGSDNRGVDVNLFEVTYKF